MPTQSVMAVRRYLQAELVTLFPDAAVSRGDPGDAQPSKLIAVQETRAPTSRPTGSANRTRERLMETDIIVSVYYEGDETVTDLAESDAMAIGEAFEQWMRQPGTDNPRLGGLAVDSYVSNMTLTPATAWGGEDGDSNLVPMGRVATLTVTVTTQIRF